MACISNQICSFSTEEMLYQAKNPTEFLIGLHALCENEFFSPAVHDFCSAISTGSIESFFSTKLLKQIIASPILTYVFSHFADWRSSTPLHHIAYEPESTNTKFGLSSHDFNKLLKILVQNGNVNAENIIGSTPLHLAADRANSFMAHFLSNLPSINPNANNAYFQNTPLHLAIMIRQDESDYIDLKRACIARMLLRHPQINPNRQNQAGDTPAHYAAASGNPYALQALAGDSNTDFCIQNNNGNTPAHLLIGNKNGTVDGVMYEILSKAASNCLNLHNKRGLTAEEALKQNFEQGGGLPPEEIDKEISA